ncbi:type II toxin-antitoxin system VapC family toxin [Inquilinus limosus]|uniref:type II toxin-antitoxin system VapC family toxin n=1 Tax=Inquilinus limosus TaxID=171674 RepID=UPI003F148AEC
MTIIADASLVAKLLFDEPGTAEAEAVVQRGDPLIAPELIIAELASLAWKKRRRQELSAEDSVAAVALAARMLERLEPVVSLRQRAMEIANELDHSPYDCFYLALAEREQGRLATFDRGLSDRVSASRYASLLLVAD